MEISEFLRYCCLFICRLYLERVGFRSLKCANQNDITDMQNKYSLLRFSTIKCICFKKIVIFHKSGQQSNKTDSAIYYPHKKYDNNLVVFVSKESNDSIICF